MIRGLTALALQGLGAVLAGIAIVLNTVADEIEDLDR